MEIFDLLDETRPTQHPSRESVDSIRSLLLVAATPAPDSHRRRRIGRRGVASLVAAIMATGGGAIAWAMSSRDPAATTSIECGTGSIIPSASGNPIADCERALQRQMPDVPPLVGWVTSNGAIYVLPEGQKPPAGSTPLATGFEQDRSVLYVNDQLNDSVGPLATRCMTKQDAVGYAHQQLAIAGLVSWTVQVARPSEQAANLDCFEYLVAVYGPARTVTLSPQRVYNLAGNGKEIYDANPSVRLDRLLHSQLTGTQCFTLAAAAELAHRDIQQLGIRSETVSVSRAGPLAGTGESGLCAVPTVDPAGSVDVTLWALSRATPPSP